MFYNGNNSDQKCVLVGAFIHSLKVASQLTSVAPEQLSQGTLTKLP